ncbi:MAG: hypothetical protein ABIR70_14735 [Bryobacteraceae bacterium]
MRFDKLSIAAWILSLATDPARATTTVGDFAEDSSNHERTWFWRQIAHTLGAHILHDFTQAPIRLLLGATAALISSIAAYYAAVISYTQFLMVYLTVVPSTSDGPAPGEIPLAITYIVTVHVAFGVGMARLSRHPLPLWVAWSILCTLLWLAYSVTGGRLATYPIQSSLLILLGVVWQRRLSLKAA